MSKPFEGLKVLHWATFYLICKHDRIHPAGSGASNSPDFKLYISPEWANIPDQHVASTTWSQSHSARIHVRAPYITSAHVRLGWFCLFAFRTICFCASVAETCLGFTQPNTTGEAWVNHHLHTLFPPLCCCSKNGSHRVQKVLHPIKTSVTQQAIIKRRSDGWWQIYKRVFLIHSMGALPLLLAVHSNKSDEMMLFNSKHADTGQISVGDNGERFPWGWRDLLRGTKGADQEDQTSPGRV